MPNYTVSRSKHATLSVSTVDTVTFSVEVDEVEVENRGTSTGDIFFTIDGTTPTAGGDNTFVAPAGTSLVVSVSGATPAVKLISTAAQPYSVTRADL